MSAPRKPDTTTFEVGGARITLARRTNRHALWTDRVDLLLADESDDAAMRGYKRLFARLVAQVVEVEGDLGFELPSPSEPVETLQAAFDAFLDADGAVGDACFVALQQVNVPLGPRAFLPPDELGEDERKKTPSAGGSGDADSAPSSGG